MAARTELLRNDMLRRRKMLSARPTKKLELGKGGGFIWRPRPPSFCKQAVRMGSDAAAASYTDASSLLGWGAALGDLYVQGRWAKLDKREGINWQEMWVLKTSLEFWGDRIAGKLVLAYRGRQHSRGPRELWRRPSFAPRAVSPQH